MLKSFTFLTISIGLFGCILMFLGVVLAGLIFIIFVVPETKGKCLDVALDKSEAVERQPKNAKLNVSVISDGRH